MADYAQPSITRAQLSIARLPMLDHDFKIKPNVIQMLHNNVKFNEFQEEDPNAHT